MGKNLKNGVELKYPLTPKAEGNVKSLAPHVSESLTKDIEGFLRSLRSEQQPY